MDRVKGFTLVELMVTIAVAAVLLGIAVPSFQTVSRNNAVRTTTNDLISTINTARQQSMGTRSQVEVSAVSGGWSKGWLLDYDDDNLGEDAEFKPARGVSISGENLVFQARGGRQNGSKDVEFTVAHSDSSITSRTFCVSFFGKVTQGECE